MILGVGVKSPDAATTTPTTVYKLKKRLCLVLASKWFPLSLVFVMILLPVSSSSVNPTSVLETKTS